MKSRNIGFSETLHILNFFLDIMGGPAFAKNSPFIEEANRYAPILANPIKGQSTQNRNFKPQKIGMRLQKVELVLILLVVFHIVAIAVLIIECCKYKFHNKKLQ